MRRHGFLAVADTLANDDGTNQSCDTRIDVYNRAACEVKREPAEPEPAWAAGRFGSYQQLIASPEFRFRERPPASPSSARNG